MTKVRLILAAIGLICAEMTLVTIAQRYVTEDNPPVEECGVRNQSDRWPFHVGLYRGPVLGNESFYFCGGTIVSGSHVVVSAHCVAPYAIELLSVRYGVSDLAEPEQTERCRVEQLIVHPDYKAPDFSNDVALLQLRDPIPIGALAQPVCLWPADTTDTAKMEDLAGTRGTAIGWGIGPRNFYAIELQNATTEILRQARCMEVFTKKLFERNEFFCAVTPVCSGSGGSGFYVLVAGRYYLRGITTFGIEAKGAYKCGVNTLTGLLSMAKYTAWIQQQIALYESPNRTTLATEDRNQQANRTV
uniref:Peptidase S1 domain-containing protein n=1 Tax=Anopheles dirus TaxID=7168 RepID=A0A182NJK3_9DIPT